MLSKETLEECLETGKFYCLKTNQVVEDKPKNRKVYDSVDFPTLFNLVISGDCYPKKYAKVFGKSPESFTAWIKTYAVKNDLEIPDIRSIYHDQIVEATEATMMDRYNCRHNWAKGPLRDELEAKWLEELGAKSPLESPKIQAMIEETNLHNLGVRRPFQSPKIQQKVVDTVMEEYKVKTTLLEPNTMAKIKATNQLNLGVDYPFQSPKIQRMCRESMVENWEVEFPFQSPEIRAMARQTMIENWKVPYSGQSEEIVAKQLETKAGNDPRFAKLLEFYDQKDRGELDADEAISFIINNYKPTQICVHLTNLGLRNKLDFMTEIKAGLLLESLGVEHIHNALSAHGVRKNTGYYELDFYIKDADIPGYPNGLGIEINGLQNHSVNTKAMGKGDATPIDYHFNKFKKFHDNGILMISFTDHEQEKFEEIYCNLIKYHLKLMSIDELRASITPEFLDFNGIESIEQSLNYGLFDSSKLTDDFENHKHQRFIKQYEYWDCGVIKH
jgi:hypothetical protein|nr:MAG TPA: endonuclease-like protein [Myoviridae sp. ctTS62]